jgi:hypothetical protein
MPNGTKLPFSVSNFQGIYEFNKINIHWKSYTDSNVSHYRIEKSSEDRMKWNTISNVPAKAKPGIVNYNITDNNIQTSNIYRLVVVEKDGKSHLYRTININVDNKSLIISPNPIVGSVLKIQTNGIMDYTTKFVIFDSKGMVVYQNALKFETNSFILPNLSKGVYYLKTMDGKSPIYKLIKF